MPDGVSDVDPGYRIAHEALRRLAPEKLPDLALVWQAYQKRPSAPDDLADRDRLLGSGLGSQLTTWAPLIVTFIVTEVLGGAMLDAARDGVRSSARQTWRNMKARFRRPSPESAGKTQPVFTPEQIEVVAGSARQTALRQGHPPEKAQLFADAMAGALSVATVRGDSADDDPT